MGVEMLKFAHILIAVERKEKCCSQIDSCTCSLGVRKKLKMIIGNYTSGLLLHSSVVDLSDEVETEKQIFWVTVTLPLLAVRDCCWKARGL